MGEILTIKASEIAPPREAVLSNQGVPAGHAVSAEIDALFDAAMELLAEFADPKAIYESASSEAFADIYRGDGKNEPQTPVGDIFGQADRLALFAVTLGVPVCEEISRRFALDDFALGCMLDSAASVAADQLAEVAERCYFDQLVGAGYVDAEARALRYSPGYCGWHISGQRALFSSLRPQAIGISLRESFLMDPLKSVSGVVIVGPNRIHEFDDVYPFCSQCTTRGCRARIAALEGP